MRGVCEYGPFTMKNLFRSILFSSLLVAAATLYGAGMPAVDVTVSDNGGKLAYKGRTAPNGTFATGNLEPGKYVVQFNSRNAAVKGNHYALVVSAGKQKVVAEAVSGDKMMAGGVAIKVDVGRGLNITGQLSTGKAVTVESSNARVRIMNGKRYVWVGPETGSNMGGRWVEEGTPAASNVHRIGTEGVQNMQDRGMQGGVPGN